MLVSTGDYIHWLCSVRRYFNGSARKVELLQTLLAFGMVKIVNGEPVDSPDVEVMPLVNDRHYDDDDDDEEADGDEDFESEGAGGFWE